MAVFPARHVRLWSCSYLVHRGKTQKMCVPVSPCQPPTPFRRYLSPSHSPSSLLQRLRSSGLLLVLQLLSFDVLLPKAPSLPLTLPCPDSCIRKSKPASVARRKFGGGCCHNQGEGDRGQCCCRCQGRSKLFCNCGSSVHPSSFLCR